MSFSFNSSLCLQFERPIPRGGVASKARCKKIYQKTQGQWLMLTRETGQSHLAAWDEAKQ